jgi:hypothetical protein
MARYVIEKGADDGMYNVNGLENDFLKGRTHSVFMDPSWTFKELVYDVRSNNKNVQHDDVFVCPDGTCLKVDGALLVPCDDPANNTSTPTTGQTTPQQQCSCANTPGAACGACQGATPSPSPVTAIPAVVVDDQGIAVQMTLMLSWPGATSSQILTEIEKQNNPKMPGDIIAVIDIPAINSRIMEVRYGKSKLVITVG